MPNLIGSPPVIRCPDCKRDPDPRGPSACHACRELQREHDLTHVMCPFCRKQVRIVPTHGTGLAYGEMLEEHSLPLALLLVGRCPLSRAFIERKVP